MTRVGLAVLVVLLLATGRGMAWNVCGIVNASCCDSAPFCDTGLVCDPSNTSGCSGLVWLGPGEGGAAGDASTGCPGTCVEPTATPTATSTPTATATSTPTPTATHTPHNLADTDPCTDSRQCASTLCNGGVCATANPAPAVSNHNAVVIAAGLLLAGLWSVRRVARRR
jgi:hypothetical protein